MQTRKERKVTVQSASKNQNIVAVPGNANWVNKEIVLTSKKNIVQRRIERLLCKVQAGVGNIVTLPGSTDWQSGRKYVIMASAMRAEQGPCEPI